MENLDVAFQQGLDFVHIKIISDLFFIAFLFWITWSKSFRKWLVRRCELTEKKSSVWTIKIIPILMLVFISVLDCNIFLDTYSLWTKGKDCLLFEKCNFGGIGGEELFPKSRQIFCTNDNLARAIVVKRDYFIKDDANNTLNKTYNLYLLPNSRLVIGYFD